MQPFIIFKFFSDRKARMTFLIMAATITVVYIAFSVLLALVATRPFPKGPITDVILFGGFKAFAGFLVYDWIMFVGLILVGAMLFANYSYWKCKTKRAGTAGVTAGVLVATCPACILPALGIASLGAGVAIATNIAKLAILVLMVGATYFIVNKQQKCEIKPPKRR